MSELNLDENLKEAIGILDCIELNDEKLKTIAKEVSDKIKNNEKINEVLKILTNSTNDGADIKSFDDFYDVIKKKNLSPILENIINELGKNPEIIENIQKKILPILFKE
ncbi:MAG: hypothetical protein ACTSYF_14405 [Promethearchaeota archaeon]